MSTYIDVSLPLKSGMLTWPGDEDVLLKRIFSLERGDPYNLSRLRMGLHAGTHLDAPLHFLPRGEDIASMPPEAGIGPARIVEIPGKRAIGRADLEPFSPHRGERFLIKTLNSRDAWWERPFDPNYAHLKPDAAAYLAERRIRLLGVDYLSVGPFGEEAAEVHRLLLEAGIWILEGLILGEVEPGDYELICLPLRVANGDGSPARAILRTPA